MSTDPQYVAKWGKGTVEKCALWPTKTHLNANFGLIQAVGAVSLIALLAMAWYLMHVYRAHERGTSRRVFGAVFMTMLQLGLVVVFNAHLHLLNDCFHTHATIGNIYLYAWVIGGACLANALVLFALISTGREVFGYYGNRKEYRKSLVLKEMGMIPPDNAPPPPPVDQYGLPTEEPLLVSIFRVLWAPLSFLPGFRRAEAEPQNNV